MLEYSEERRPWETMEEKLILIRCGCYELRHSQYYVSIFSLDISVIVLGEEIFSFQ